MALHSGWKASRLSRLQSYKSEMRQDLPKQIQNSFSHQLNPSFTTKNTLQGSSQDSCVQSLLLIQSGSFLSLPVQVQNLIIGQNSRFSQDQKITDQDLLDSDNFLKDAINEGYSYGQQPQQKINFKDNFSNNVFCQAVLRQTQKRRIQPHTTNKSESNSIEYLLLSNQNQNTPKQSGTTTSCFYENKNYSSPTYQDKISSQNKPVTAKSLSSRPQTANSFREIFKNCKGRSISGLPGLLDYETELQENNRKSLYDAEYPGKKGVEIEIRGVKVANTQNKQNEQFKQNCLKQKRVIKHKKLLKFIQNKQSEEVKQNQSKSMTEEMNDNIKYDQENIKKIAWLKKLVTEQSPSSNIQVTSPSLTQLSLKAIGKSLNVSPKKQNSSKDKTQNYSTDSTVPLPRKQNWRNQFQTYQESMINHTLQSDFSNNLNLRNRLLKTQQDVSYQNPYLFLSFPGFENIKQKEFLTPQSKLQLSTKSSIQESSQSKKVSKGRPTTSPSSNQFFLQRARFSHDRPKEQLSVNQSFSVKRPNTTEDQMFSNTYSTPEPNNNFFMCKPLYQKKYKRPQRREEEKGKRESQELVELVSYYHNKYEDKLFNECQIKPTHFLRLKENANQDTTVNQQFVSKSQNEELLPWALMGEETEDPLISRSGSKIQK